MINQEKQENYVSIPLEKIEDGYTIRKTYNKESIIKLAESIKTYGQLQPICVYLENDKYVTIYGLRRFWACLKLEMKKIKAIVIPKPTKVEIIYLQINENEVSKRLSYEEREEYIYMLKKNSESYEEIAQKIGRSVSWVRICFIVYNLRNKYKNTIKEYGIKLSTKEVFCLRNANLKQVQNTVKQIVDDPENKKHIIFDLNIKTKKKKNVGGKRKNLTESHKKSVIPIESIMVEKFPEIKDLKIKLSIELDNEKKVIKVQKENSDILNKTDADSIIRYLQDTLNYKILWNDSDKDSTR